MNFELKLTELFYKYYFDQLKHGEAEADKRLRTSIESGEYTDAFVEMFKEGIKQAGEIAKFEVVNEPEDSGNKGEMH